MKKLNKIIFSLVIALVLLILPQSVNAAGDISVYYNEETVGSEYYLVYSNSFTGSCGYTINNGGVPGIFAPCDVDSGGYNVVRIDKADADLNSHLWIQIGAGVPFSYDLTNCSDIAPSCYVKALSSVTAAWIENDLHKLISVVNNHSDPGSVTITENLGTYQYAIINIDQMKDHDENPVNPDYVSFNETARSLLDISSYSPYDLILLMWEFNNFYENLLTEVSWVPLPSNKTIVEKEWTNNEDQIIIWLKRSDGTIDIQILDCEKEVFDPEEKERTILERLPYTGVTNYLEILLTVNFVILAIAYLGQRKLKKRYNVE